MHSSWFFLDVSYNCFGGLAIGNEMHQAGEVLVDWKLVNVVPGFKKCNYDDPGNCRPVRLTSVTGKLWRRLLREVLKST